MSRRNVADTRMTEETLEATPSIETSPDTESPETPALTQDSAVTQEEFDRLKAERDSLLDRVARVQAEFDNARKREARERADFRDYAVANAVEQFLPVLDNFQLALKSNGTLEQLRAAPSFLASRLASLLKAVTLGNGISRRNSENAVRKRRSATRIPGSSSLSSHCIIPARRCLRFALHIGSPGTLRSCRAQSEEPTTCCREICKLKTECRSVTTGR